MMLDLDFRDAVTGDRVPSPDDGTYSIVELSREHRERYVLQTKAGAIVMQKLPLRLYRVLQSCRLHTSSRMQDLMDELNALMPKDGDYSNVQDDIAERIRDIADQLAFTDYSALGVIVAPQITTMDDYEELVSKLDDDERTQLYTCVQTLSRVVPYEEVDPTPQVIADKLGIKVLDPTMCEFLTVSQSAYWATRIRQEQDAIRRAQRER